ncbi:MAG: terminase family protein [Candidatus Accumulibacter sp.]|nr:terminase family protein [Accumulibacter sp.]
MTPEILTVRFGYPMRSWQRECARLSEGRRFVVMALHRRAGKTELALKKLLDAAVRNTLDLPLYLYVAPLLKQAKSIAWSRLKQMVSPLRAVGAVEVNESETSVKFVSNGALVRLCGADNPDATRGVRLDGCVIDEVAQVKPEVWEEILMPALSDRKGWCWFIGTPKGINLFSALFFAAESREDWARARYTVYETDALDADEVERMRAEMSEAAFAREYLCDFSAAGDDQLISLTDVEDAARRVHAPDAFGHAARVLGVDPARFGNDRSVIFPRQGLVAFPPQVYRGIDNMALAGRVAQKIEAWRPDAVFIDSGAGAGVIDRLRQLGHDVIEVNFGGRANDPRYANKRAEMWFEMADAIRSGLSIPNDNALKLELATPTYRFDAQNRILIESKDDIKKRLPDAASPDLADALALTYAAPVAPRAEGRGATPRRDYDPYADF